jgi:hypothetical protein
MARSKTVKRVILTLCIGAILLGHLARLNIALIQSLSNAHAAHNPYDDETIHITNILTTPPNL